MDDPRAQQLSLPAAGDGAAALRPAIVAADHLAFALLVLLAAALPFGMHGFTVAGHPVSWLRAVTLLLVVIGGPIALLHRKRPSALPAIEIALPALALAAVHLASAFAASHHQRASVLHAILSVEGVVLMTAIAMLVRTRARRDTLVLALLASAGSFAALGLVEVAAGDALDGLLMLFHGKARGTSPRELGSTFGAGELASTLLCPAAALTATWYLSARDRSTAAGAYVLYCLLATAQIRTLSVTGWVALGLAILVIATLVYEASPWRRAAMALTLPALAALIAVLDPGATARALERTPMRMYGALIRTRTAELAVRPGKPLRLVVDVTNAGTFSWGGAGEPPVTVGLRWFDAPTGRLLAEDATASPVPPVPAGEQATVLVTGRTPISDGPMLLAVDLVEDGSLWYERMTLSATVLRCVPVTAGLLDCQPARTADRAVVRGAAGSPPAPDPSDRRLWRAGIDMVKANPVLGEGPDGFRFSYWRYAAVESHATTARLGNVYLQVAAELGLLGLAALLWLATSVLWRLWVALHRCTSVSDRLLAGSLLGAFVSLVIQGSGVSYLGTTGLVFLMWIIAGLAASLRVPAEARGQA